MIKCQIDQVEKLVPVMLEVPTQTSPRQRAKVEVPQMSNFRFGERFRWPVDQVLMLGLGMVALPVPVDTTPTIAGLPLPLPSSPARADLLLIIENNGSPAETLGAAQAAVPGARRGSSESWNAIRYANPRSSTAKSSSSLRILGNLTPDTPSLGFATRISKGRVER